MTPAKTPANTPAQRHLADLRGATRLAADATLGLAGLVEAMHARIASVPGTAGPAQTAGITGLVYRSVRGVTRLVGGTLDGLLGALSPLLGARADAPAGVQALEPWREREALVAVLNGVLGDHLEATHNPLAITMSLRRAGRPLTLEPAALQSALKDHPSLPTGRLLVLVHGLCMNDLGWQRQGHDHGAALAAELGYTPVYLHYNTGRAIAVSGADFGALMARLIDAWPVPLTRVALLGHSMGGLVIRSALHQHNGQPWTQRVDDAVFLGTPHLGAPLERAGHGVEMLLAALPYAGPLARLARIRSAGITDLRQGHVGTDEQPVPLPDAPRCHAVAASTGPAPGNLKGRLLGDGLVPVDSALGRHRLAARTLRFAADRQVLLQDLNHLDLLSSLAVMEPLRRWLR